MNRLAALALALAVIAAAALAGESSAGPAGLLRRRYPAFEQAAADMLASGRTETEIPGVLGAHVYGGGDGAIVQFTTGGGSFLGPDAEGVYYSQSGRPAAFRNWDCELERREDGWAWYGESVATYGETRRISGNWFSFSANIS